MFYNTVFISDIHLFSGRCKGEKLSLFLRELECYRLVLVGDTLDGWAAKAMLRCNDGEEEVIKELIKKSSGNTVVDYIVGNHDDFLLEYVETNIPLINFHNEMVYTDSSFEDYIVVHGHQFDRIMMSFRNIAVIGTMIQRLYLWLTGKKWSLSDVIIKQADYELITKFTDTAVKYVHDRSWSDGIYRGIICGHTHFPYDKIVDGIHFLNCGDWINSCTAVVDDGEMLRLERF